MSNATLRAPTFVQTQFLWEDEQTPSTSTATQSDRHPGAAVSVRTPVSRTSTVPSNRLDRGPQSTNRIGGCVHVGSPLVKVLGKYGFSLDDLLIEIERQKKAAS